jgi:hypothetical protein
VSIHPKNYLFVSIIFCLFSCEKKIDFPLKEAVPLLSVDASIESDTFPVVILTKSINFFSKVTPEILSSAMVNDAIVEIENSNKTIRLTKQEILFPGNLKYIYYTCDPVNTGQQLRGKVGEKYTLTITWQNKIYTSSTTIPLLRKTVDSLWWAKAPATPDTSTKIILKGLFTDPPFFGDYVRYFTKVNNEPFLPGRNSAFDDLFVNGTRYEIDIPKGVDRNLNEDLLNDQFFRRGDTITVKLSNIDKATYDFWRTTEFSYQSAGNPFSSPVKIMGNISNGALGYFGGYANQFRKIIIPPL